jgi:hypothetical protein
MARGSRPKVSLNDAVARAEALMAEMLADAPEAVDPPDGMAHYVPVAAFTTESVSQATSEWGDLKLTLRVPRGLKYEALPATDFPGKRLFVVVYAPHTPGGDDAAE